MRSLTLGQLRAGLDSVRHAKLRSFWMMFGVIIGVTSVISVVAIGEGVKQQVRDQMHSYGDDLITIRPAQLATTLDSGNPGLNLLAGLSVNTPLSAKDVETVRKVPGIAASAPLTIANGTVDAPNGRYRNALVLGTTGDLPSLINQSLAYGIFLSDVDADARVAVLGQGAVDEMFDEAVPLGRSFTFHGERFIVRGIFNTFNTTPLTPQADFNKAIFIPYDVAQSLSKRTAPTYAMMVRPENDRQTEKVAGGIRSALAKAHGNGGRDTLEVLTGDDNLRATNSILDLLTRLIAGVAGISLLVGGIGILNVMMVSVAERTHEIGIRKAIGATNRQILSQFMIESSILTLAGGIIGISLAFVVNITLRLTTNLKPVISWEIVVLATIISLAIGIIFGTIPAVKAARKDPIEALRTE